MSAHDTRETIARFDDRADDYVRYRPDYPAAAIDAIVEGLGPTARTIAADVGAGTGISARQLADRGVRVIAVEPGEVMRSAATPHARVRWMSSRAQAIGLASASVDLAVCAQSFHWFHTAEAVADLARIVRPGGRLALMWNRRSKTDPLTAGYRQAIVEVGGEIEAERMAFDPAIVSAGGAFEAPDRVAFAHVQRRDLDALIGRARSASYVPTTGEAAERLLTLLRALHTQHADADGIVRLVYETEVWRSRRT